MIISEIDVAEGTRIDRDPNEIEQSQAIKDAAELASIMKKFENDKKAKLALLERLGITADEAALLVQ
jgi:hypothetical protein